MKRLSTKDLISISSYLSFFVGGAEDKKLDALIKKLDDIVAESLADSRKGWGK